ncbi:recombinase family protein [Tateyamaria armeniaca]|uniref:Recombinase family protein n=1 Tax=Tateyamaria armeniaca TaxID=2518930 RepID=A0ABW8UNR1_9RHOB
MSNKQCFAYTRVSTVKQGDGVSLEAQHEANAAFAQRNALTITKCFEEKETAAKSGRPVFDTVVRSLHAGAAAGLVVHKIDRSARNFADWARIGDLVDSGIDVHFAHDSLDLRSRGGRLTADIQAVIATDYVRNLREESIKGMEGRLKQGLFPWAAPIGYLDQGGGKPKVPDPMRAPLVLQAFEWYATGQYSFKTLLTEMRKRGLTNRYNKPITKGCLENMMSNPFYRGVVLLKRTGRRYAGQHKPIVPHALFDRVQALKSDKQIKKSTLHNHAYRQLIRCAACGRSLIGELQKAHVYYRCHTKGCSKTSIREDVFEQAISLELLGLRLSPADQHCLEIKMQHWLQKGQW